MVAFVDANQGLTEIVVSNPAPGFTPSACKVVSEERVSLCKKICVHSQNVVLWNHGKNVTALFPFFCRENDFHGSKLVTSYLGLRRRMACACAPVGAGLWGPQVIEFKGFSEIFA